MSGNVTRPESPFGSPRWKDPVATITALPSAGNAVDDVRAVSDTKKAYIWNGSSWQDFTGVVGAINYQGTWNASTNSPTLSDATGIKGHYYVVSIAGTQDLGSGPIAFSPSDWVVHNGTIWEKADHTDFVISVFGRTGAVAAAASDYDASQVDNDSGVAGVTVKDALDTLGGICADVSCSVYRSTGQAINDSTLTPIAFDAETWDTDAMHDPAVNPSRITVPAGEAGKYLAIAKITWTGNANGVRSTTIHVNGALISAGYVNPVGIFTTIVLDVKVLNLVAGDYVEMHGYQTSGGVLNIIAGATWTYLQLVRQRG